MLFEGQSGGLGHLHVSKVASIALPLHALHPASSWQPPLLKGSSSSLQPNDLVTRKFLKRPRPVEIDRVGESVSRKKRRLGRDLVTSRLSRPYATPPTHIARGAWRLGVWARQRSSGGLLLRKGAILNSIAKKRKRAVLDSTKEGELHEANIKPMYGKTCCVVLPLANIVRSQSDPSHELPLQAPSKPFSVFTSSDYNAFDYEEDDLSDNEGDEEDNAGDEQPVYSDFRILGSSDSDEGFGDASYSFDTLDTSYHLGIDLGEKAIDLVIENERQEEVSAAPLTPGILPPSFSRLAVGL